MIEEIKEILDYIDERIIPNEKWNKIKDYITNLQQDLEKANDIIEKDRQFYKCRMDEYAELKKENEELNRMCELYSKSLYNAELTDYKSRCLKAIEYINENLTLVSILDGKKFYGLNDYKFDYQDLLNILNGVDENE